LGKAVQAVAAASAGIALSAQVAVYLFVRKEVSELLVAAFSTDILFM
jgi:hypothetical protein